MIKTANQKFIAFNEPLICYYLIAYIFPLAKRRSKINMKETLENIEDIDILMLN